MRLRIRRARKTDAPALVGLIRALAEFEGLPPPDDDAAARLVRDGWGSRPRFEAWLAEADGEIVGYAILFHTYSTFLARPTLYLEDIFVLPRARGMGVGSALFAHARALALKRGCGRMEWCCLDWNVNAQRFYERAGARRLDEWVYYRLTGERLGHATEGDIDAA